MNCYAAISNGLVKATMKTLISLTISAILAAWISIIAIVSVQNAAPVTLRFFTFESIQLPVGLVLSFSVGLGLIGGAIALPLLTRSSSPYAASFASETEEDDEFEF